MSKNSGHNAPSTAMSRQVTVIMANADAADVDLARLEVLQNRKCEYIKGVICGMTAEEVDDIVLAFGSKFREHYAENFNSAYFQLGKYLDKMDEENNGHFSRRLITDCEMREVVDLTLKISQDRRVAADR